MRSDLQRKKELKKNVGCKVIGFIFTLQVLEGEAGDIPFCPPAAQVVFVFDNSSSNPQPRPTTVA